MFEGRIYRQVGHGSNGKTNYGSLEFDAKPNGRADGICDSDQSLIEQKNMGSEHTSADENYRAEFIAELCRKGVVDADSQKSAEGIIYDPKVSPVEKVQLHLAAKQMSNYLLGEDSFAINQ